jgi:deoxyribose-phosphate aldolase
MPALTREEITVLVEAIAGGLLNRTGSPTGSMRSERPDLAPSLHSLEGTPSREPRAGTGLAPGTGQASPCNASGGVEGEFGASSPELRRLASLIDHTLLGTGATRLEVLARCGEALELGFAVVCVNPIWVPLVTRELRRSHVKVGTVVGFPLGATLASSKRAEAEAALRVGAQEIDMVMNVGALRSGELDRVESDIRGVVEVCQAGGATLKVILENGYLSDEEKAMACRIAQRAGADFVKTATGFGSTGATEKDVRLMRATVGAEMGVKAAGGIRTLAAALAMLKAGANRLGTSAGVSILREATRGKN